MIGSAPIIDPGGPQPLVAEAGVPVYPTLAMPLGNNICTHTIMYSQPYIYLHGGLSISGAVERTVRTVGAQNNIPLGSWKVTIASPLPSRLMDVTFPPPDCL